MGSPISQLSQELIDEIIDHLKDSFPTLSACSLLSTKFVRRTRQRLFQEITFRSNRRDASKPPSNMAAFLEITMHRPSILTYVRHLRLLFYPPSMSWIHSNQEFLRIVDALKCMDAITLRDESPYAGYRASLDDDAAILDNFWIPFVAPKVKHITLGLQNFPGEILSISTNCISLTLDGYLPPALGLWKREPVRRPLQLQSLTCVRAGTCLNALITSHILDVRSLKYLKCQYSLMTHPWLCTYFDSGMDLPLEDLNLDLEYFVIDADAPYALRPTLERLSHLRSVGFDVATSEKFGGKGQEPIYTLARVIASLPKPSPLRALAFTFQATCSISGGLNGCMMWLFRESWGVLDEALDGLAPVVTAGQFVEINIQIDLVIVSHTYGEPKPSSPTPPPEYKAILDEFASHLLPRTNENSAFVITTKYCLF